MYGGEVGEEDLLAVEEGGALAVDADAVGGAG